MVLVFGILGCYPFPFLGPFAWMMGNTEIERIDAGLLPESGRRSARVGRMLGVVASVFWGALMIFFMILFLLYPEGILQTT